MTQSKQTNVQSTTTPAAAGNPMSLPIGTILATVANNAPSDWLLCDGSVIPEAYSELIELLGNKTTPNLVGRTLVGAGSISTSNAVQADGSTPNFAFPSSLINLPSGYTGGEYQHTLSLPEMPCHQHFGWGEANGASGSNGNDDNGAWGFGRSNGDANWFGANGNDSDNYLYGSTFAGGVLNTDGTTNQIPTSSGQAGTAMTGTAAHLTMQPYYAVNYIIFAGQS